MSCTRQSAFIAPGDELIHVSGNGSIGQQKTFNGFTTNTLTQAGSDLSGYSNLL